MSHVSFRTDLTAVINRHSLENGSNTPDYVIAGFLAEVLDSLDRAVRERDRWYGRVKSILEEEQ